MNLTKKKLLGLSNPRNYHHNSVHLGFTHGSASKQRFDNSYEQRTPGTEDKVGKVIPLLITYLWDAGLTQEGLENGGREQSVVGEGRQLTLNSSDTGTKNTGRNFLL